MGLKRATSAAAAAAAVACVTLIGCSGPAVSSLSAPTASPTIVPTPGVSPSIECTAQAALAQAKRLLAGQDVEVHYLSIADALTLSVWFVDPEIDPATRLPDIPAVGRRARERGLAISYELFDEIPCVRHVFDQINPMIVDRRFQHWYKDFLPVRAFVGLHNPTTDDLIDAVEAAGTALQSPRSIAPKAAQTPAAASCGWSDARAAIHTYFGAEDNTAAYLIIGAGLVRQGSPDPSAAEDAGVEVQLTVHGAAQATDELVRERLGHVAQALACMAPAIDTLEAFIVDSTGQTLLYAVVTGPTIRSGRVPLPPGGVRLYHMTPSVQP